MAGLATDELAGLIEKKHEILMRLHDIGGRQVVSVRHSDVAELLKLLALKQQLIGALQTVERALSPFRQENPDRRQWRSAEDRARCAAQAAQCNEMLSEILHLERQSEDHMITRRNEVASRLQQFHASAQACGAYAENQGKTPPSPKSQHTDFDCTDVAPSPERISQVGTSRLNIVTGS